MVEKKLNSQESISSKWPRYWKTRRIIIIIIIIIIIFIIPIISKIS